MMQANLTWKKGLFSSEYKIYSDSQLIGKLKDKSFSQSGIGKFNNREYLFKTKGFFKQRTQIIDIAENKVIGEITYNNWMTKANIRIKNETSHWKYDNFLNTKWSLFDADGLSIRYSGSSTKGKINSNVEDPLLILSGLFVTNFYWQMTFIVIIAALIPIWTAFF